MKRSEISVVVASGAGGEFLFRCLDSLQAQDCDSDFEIIVADRCGEETVKRIRREYPRVIVVTADHNTRPSVPELRWLGVSHSTADVIAVIEEHCSAPPEWIRTIKSSFRGTDAAIGGPILDDDYGRLRDWVVYFSEYHNFLPPWSDGPRFMLNGANIAYNRQKLLAHENVLRDGYWEVVLHPLLAQDGDFRAVSEMGVRHTGPFNFGYYLNQRYLLSRVWGGTQRERVRFPKRVLYLLLGPLLPALLLARVSQRVLQSKHRLGKFLTVIPLMIPVVSAYALGEWLGYLVGIGDALERVE